MGKLYLYFKKNSDTVIGNILKVKLDNEKTTEIPKKEMWEVEVENGNHNIKMYTEGWTKENIVGYIEQDIMINGDCYFIYKPPIFINGKGKLIKKNYKNAEIFKNKVKNNKKITKVLELILFILALLLFIFVF